MNSTVRKPAKCPSVATGGMLQKQNSLPLLALQCNVSFRVLHSKLEDAMEKREIGFKQKKRVQNEGKLSNLQNRKSRQGGITNNSNRKHEPTNPPHCVTLEQYGVGVVAKDNSGGKCNFLSFNYLKAALAALSTAVFLFCF